MKKQRPPKTFRAHRPGWWIQIDTVVIQYASSKIYVLCAVDLYSRFAFAYAYRSPSSTNAKDFLEKLILFFPDPCSMHMIQTDNGSEFHKYFHAALEDMNIRHVWSYPKSPKMNAFVESFNKTIQIECLQRTDALADRTLLNNKILTWLIEYNTARPHISLACKVPLLVYSNYLIRLKKVHTELWTRSMSLPRKLIYLPDLSKNRIGSCAKPVYRYSYENCGWAGNRR